MAVEFGSALASTLQMGPKLVSRIGATRAITRPTKSSSTGSPVSLQRPNSTNVDNHASSTASSSRMSAPSIVGGSSKSAVPQARGGGTPSAGMWRRVAMWYSHPGCTRERRPSDQSISRSPSSPTRAAWTTSGSGRWRGSSIDSRLSGSSPTPSAFSASHSPYASSETPSSHSRCTKSSATAADRRARHRWSMKSGVSGTRLCPTRP